MRSAQGFDLIPNSKGVLTPITLGSGVATLDLTLAANFAAGAVPAGAPLILQVICDGDFYESEETPDASKNGLVPANTWWSIPVAGQTSHKFLGTAGKIVKGRLLLGT